MLEKWSDWGGWNSSEKNLCYSPITTDLFLWVNSLSIRVVLLRFWQHLISNFEYLIFVILSPHFVTKVCKLWQNRFTTKLHLNWFLTSHMPDFSTWKIFSTYLLGETFGSTSSMFDSGKLLGSGQLAQIWQPCTFLGSPVRSCLSWAKTLRYLKISCHNIWVSE